MKKIITVLILCIFILIGCGTSSATSSTETGNSKEDDKKVQDIVESYQGLVESYQDTAQSLVNKKEDSFVLNSSPDKYTQYVDKYTGMNAASVGYTSMGGDRYIRIGTGLLQVTYVTEDGSYVGPDDGEDLKNYVVVAQSIEPNTEVKLTFQKDSDGKEYDSLVDFQTYEYIDLLVKKVGSNDPNIDLVEINPSPDKYTYFIKNYVGKNVGSVGYVSLGGQYRDKYGGATILLNLAAEDGSYIDIKDDEVLKQYVVTGQNVPANSEMKITYKKDSSGEEFSNLTDSQTYESITLNVRSITGEPVVASTSQEAVDESEITESKESEKSDGGYESIYNEYAQKLENKGQELLEEYRAESKGLSIDKKAELSTAKVEILAQLVNEGVEKMAGYMLTNGNSSAYSDWASKLYDVYMEQANLIMDEYLNTAF